MSGASRRDSAKAAAATRRGGTSRRCVVAGHALWMFDFDNTLAPLEPAVDWAGSRRELQAWLAAQGVAEALFEEFPRGNLVLYEALRARLCAGGDAARAVRAAGASAASGGGRSASPIARSSTAPRPSSSATNSPAWARSRPRPARSSCSARSAPQARRLRSSRRIRRARSRRGCAPATRIIWPT